jgi:hypothetical protein
MWCSGIGNGDTEISHGIDPTSKGGRKTGHVGIKTNAQHRSGGLPPAF